MSYKIEQIEGIGPAFGEKLRAADIGTTEALLERSRTPKQRDALAEATGISGALLLKWANRADLMRVKGIGTEYADLLEAAGVDTVPELAQRNAANLTKKMEEVNAAKNLVRATPVETTVSKWIEAAKSMDRALEY